MMPRKQSQWRPEVGAFLDADSPNWFDKDSNDPTIPWKEVQVFSRSSDNRTRFGRKPYKNEAWLDIRYDSESFESQDTTTLSCGHTLVLGADDIHYGDSERPMTCPICVDNLRKYGE